MERRPLVYRDPRALKDYERNARKHPATQIAQLRRSYREWGFTNPILVDEHDAIIAGHGRKQMALEEGLAEVPCIVLAGLTDEQKRALVLADNKLAINATWDDDLLAAELEALKGLDFDLTKIGFTDDELAGLLATKDGNTDPDDVPEVPIHPVTILGDTWLLGRHRMRCGDSTAAADVTALLAGVKPLLLVTDPPYGVEYDPAWRKDLDDVKRNVGKVENDNRADWREAWALFQGDVAYVWSASLFTDVAILSLESAGFVRRSQIIWCKPHFAIGRGDYHWQHELCWYAVRKAATGHYCGDRKQSTVWQIDNSTIATGGRKGKGEDASAGGAGHGTQKPVECMRRPIENNSSPGQAVYEPFSGSGTTIIAGEQTGRAVLAMELSPAYVDVALHRWQNFTGLKAVHEATGLSFAEIAESRGVALPPTVPLKVKEPA